MDNMKKNRILLIALCALIATVVGVSFAYFVVQTRLEGEGAGTTATPAELMKVEFDAGESALNASNLMPGGTGSKAFKVTVTPTSTENNAVYAIALDISNNTFVKCDDTNYNEVTNACKKNAEEIVYRLKNSSGKIISTGDLTAKTGKITLLKENKTVSSATDFNYTLEIEYVNTNRDQNHNKNKALNANVVVEFTTLDVSKAADTLIAKNEMVYENGYRYEGKNPNNYVRFNNELWRIIGVFEVETTSGTTEQLVKLIRNESIGNIVWDTSGYNGSNNWANSDIKAILNGQYYNGEDISYSYRNPSNPNISNQTVSIAGVSINSAARSMIENTKWNIGGASGNTQTASAFYIEERETVGAKANPSVATWNGYIGLMYPSDYGYAVDSAICSRTTNLDDYNVTSSCETNNWLFNSDYQWTMTPFSWHSTIAVSVHNQGYVTTGYLTFGYGVRPALYLKSNTSIINNGNDGSIDHPYTLLEEVEETPIIGEEGDIPVELD